VASDEVRNFSMVKVIPVR